MRRRRYRSRRSARVRAGEWLGIVLLSPIWIPRLIWDWWHGYLGPLPLGVQLMERRLYALRIEITPPPGTTGISEIIVHRDPGRHWPRPTKAKRWSEVEAGEILEKEDGTTCRVVAVRLYLTRGGDDCDEVVSGADWLATGRVLKPGR